MKICNVTQSKIATTDRSQVVVGAVEAPNWNDFQKADCHSTKVEPVANMQMNALLGLPLTQVWRLGNVLKHFEALNAMRAKRRL